MPLFDSKEFPEELDEFDLKLAKNYPASYKRKGCYFSTIQKITSPCITVDSQYTSKENSNKSSFSKDLQESASFSNLTQANLSKKKAELANLQLLIEGKRTEKPKSLFSKLVKAIGLT